MTETGDARLLPAAREVPFADIDRAFARLGDAARPSSPRALTATVVVVGPHARLCEAASAIERLDGAVRTILISGGTHASPPVRIAGQAVAVEGLRPQYLNNAVAALRLSSLPTLVWWRGGSLDSLPGVAHLADRLVLDVTDPLEVWERAALLKEVTALSDLRWTRLTRWRALMAHFFDIPEVRAAAPSFRRLEIRGADVHAARLFAGWIASSLRWTAAASIDVRRVDGGPAIERVRLGDDGQELELALAPSGNCVQSSARVHGHAGATRTVSLGEQGLAALFAEELRVRARDLAFERALDAMQGVS